MDSVIKLLDTVEGSLEFKEWKKKNAESYLAHAFMMMDDCKNGEWQVGYYNPNDTMTTIMIVNDNVKIGTEAEIFKEEKSKVLAVDMNKVKIDSMEAVDIAYKLREEKYKAQQPAKIIVLLQNIHNEIVYNITFLTKALKTINIKIDAATGEIVKEEVRGIMDFKVT